MNKNPPQKNMFSHFSEHIENTNEINLKGISSVSLFIAGCFQCHLAGSLVVLYASPRMLTFSLAPPLMSRHFIMEL